MITTIQDKELAEMFENTPKTLWVWKSSEKKGIRERYHAFKDRALLSLNGFGNVLDLIEENINLKKQNKEYAEKFEALKGLGK